MIVNGVSADKEVHAGTTRYSDIGVSGQVGTNGVKGKAGAIARC